MSKPRLPIQPGLADAVNPPPAVGLPPIDIGGESESSLRVSAQRQRRSYRIRVWVGRIVLPVVIIGAWQGTTSAGWVDPFFWGQPSKIWQSLVSLFTDGTAFGSIWLNLGYTILEAVLGFLLGTAFGVVIGVALGQSRFWSDICNPYIKALNSVPRILLAALFLVAFGLGLLPKVVLAGVLVFFIVFFNAYQGVREVDPNLVANVRVLGASRRQVTRHVTIPSALTWIIASLHTAFGFAIIGALVQEVIGSQHGIGLIVTQAAGHLDENTVFACIFLMAVVTLAAEYLITLLEKRVLSWRPPSQTEANAAV